MYAPLLAKAALALLCLLGLWATSAAAQDEQVTPRKVVVEGLHSIDRDELLYLMGIEKGKTLYSRDITEGIKRAFLKGIFEQIRVERSDKDENVLIITVRERDRIAEVTVRGNDVFSYRFISLNLMLKEDDLLRYDHLVPAKNELKKVLDEKGYPDAVIGFQVKRTRVPYRVELVVNVDEGLPLVIDHVQTCGTRRLQSKVQDMLDLSPGDTYDRTMIDGRVERIRAYLMGQGYLEPVVGPYTFSEGVLSICTYAGKKLSIEFKGNDFIKTRELRDATPFFDIGEVSEDLVTEAAERMYAMYRRSGFVNTQIAPFLKEDKDEIKVSYFIYEGKRTIVETVEIEGSEFEQKRLKTVMGLREKKVYDADQLESDIKRLRDYHVALGYRDTTVELDSVKIEDIQWWEQSENEAYEHFNAKAMIKLKIDQGPKVVIASLKFVGAQSIPDERLREVTGIKKGSPYNEVDISNAWRRIQNECRSYGFYFCTVSVERKFSREGVEIIFNIDEGQKLYFGRTVVRGNLDTRLAVIQRELQYEEGGELNRSLMEKTRRRLYKLKLFSRVDIETIEQEGEDADIIIDVQEGRPGIVEFGFGYGEYEEYRGFFEVGYRNLFGMNREGSVRTEFSSLESRYILNFHEPWLMGRPIESRTFLLHESRKEKNIDTGEISYRIKRYTASTGLEKQFTGTVRGSLYYEYTIAETFDLKPDVILSREDTGTLAISSLSPGIVYDSRDDPFDPQSGIFTGMKVKYASQSLLSETNFIKTTTQLSGYHSLSRRLVLAASGRAGSAEGFRGTEELPLVERFFLGGRSTVRGYDQDSLGPKGDEGTPVGGNYFLLGNLELRFLVAGNFRIVPFMDGGNVWILKENVTVNDLRYTAGLGLQYNTPVGPIRLDYGYKLNREEGESKGKFHFSLGHAF